MVTDVESHARRLFNKGLEKIPNRIGWELMGLAPIQYLNITNDEGEEEFVKSGEEGARKILSTLEEYNGFDVNNSRVMEIGTGPGRHVLAVGRRNTDIYGVDISRKNLKDTQRLTEKYGVDANLYQTSEGLPDFPVEFDLIFSTLVFQHMKRRTAIQYLQDAYNNLRDGGVVYFTFANLENDENTNSLFEDLDRKHSFRMRYFTTEEIRQYMDFIGFESLQITDDGHQLIVIATKNNQS